MSRKPVPEVVPEAAPNPLVTTETRDGKESEEAAEEVGAIAIAPLRKHEPVVTRKVSRSAVGRVYAVLRVRLG